MTNHEMRIRLAEAMGWTEIRDPLPPIWLGEDTTGMPPEGHRSCCRGAIPDPLEEDDDAARLRAWCVERGWEVEAWGDQYHAMLGLHRIGRDEDSLYRRVTLAECRVWHEDEPDPCRRERLALCRAVCQALEVEHV